jgi:hypothetical protein
VGESCEASQIEEIKKKAKKNKKKGRSKMKEIMNQNKN